MHKIKINFFMMLTYRLYRFMWEKYYKANHHVCHKVTNHMYSYIMVIEQIIAVNWQEDQNDCGYITSYYWDDQYVM